MPHWKAQKVSSTSHYTGTFLGDCWCNIWGCCDGTVPARWLAHFKNHNNALFYHVFPNGRCWYHRGKILDSTTYQAFPFFFDDASAMFVFCLHLIHKHSILQVLVMYYDGLCIAVTMSLDMGVGLFPIDAERAFIMNAIIKVFCFFSRPLPAKYFAFTCVVACRKLSSSDIPLISNIISTRSLRFQHFRFWSVQPSTQPAKEPQDSLWRS